MTATTTTPQADLKPPFWRDLRVIRATIQIVSLVVALGLGWYLFRNLQSEMRAQGLPTDFGFLDQPTGTDIADSSFDRNSPLSAALRVGIKNTFALVIVGLPLLTILGTIVGVARLSTNWLVSKVATVYVEILRNIPPLLIIFAVFNAFVLGVLPRPNEPWTPLDQFVISNLKLLGPSIETSTGAGVLWLITIVGVIVAGFVWAYRTRYSEQTGHPHHRVRWALATIVGFFVVGFIATGAPLALSSPSQEGRLITGGFGGLGSYFAILIALTLYTASHVAEIVRGSIQAVSKGQTEAANALALTGFQRLRYVVLPQSFRIALPPIINQYLNFTKNTSLAIAIGYAEITLITFQAIGNGKPAPQLILLLMMAYLVFSITISILVNILNRRLQLVGR